MSVIGAAVPLKAAVMPLKAALLPLGVSEATAEALSIIRRDVRRKETLCCEFPMHRAYMRVDFVADDDTRVQRAARLGMFAGSTREYRVGNVSTD